MTNFGRIVSSPTGVFSYSEVTDPRRLARTLLLLYLAVFYFVPMFLTLFFGQSLDEILVDTPNYIIGSLFIALISYLLWVASGKIKSPSFSALSSLGLFAFNRFAILGVAILHLVLAYQFSQQFGLSFRQTGARLEQAGGYVIALLAIQAYLYAVLLLYLGMSQARQKMEGWPAIASLGLITLGLALTLTASTGILAIGIALLLFLRSVTRIELITRKKAIGKLPIIATVVFVAPTALFVGIANKIGFDAAYYMFTSDLKSLVKIFQIRISYHFFTASFHATYNLLDFELGLRALNELLMSIGHRLDVMLGNPTYANQVASIKRLNFEEISLVYRERTGASPGLIGGIFFVPGGVLSIPLSIFVQTTLLAMVAKGAGGRDLSLFSLLFLVLSFGALVDGSIDLANPFDPAFLRLGLLVLVCAWQTAEAERVQGGLIASAVPPSAGDRRLADQPR